MKDHQDLRRLITELLAAQDHGGGAAASQTALAGGGLALTSLELVQLLVGLEERLGIELDDATVLSSSFDTIDDIVEIVALSS